jgi:V/A-type H+/Na+-transporting ATPase subunit C
MTSAHDLDFGNARVRAMRARMLSPETLERMVDMNPSDLVAALGTTDYGADLERGALATNDVGRVHAALAQNLARTFAKLRRSYAGDASRSLELLLSRWDAANLVTLVRGHARHAMPEEMQALMLPAGRLDEALLVALTRLPSLRAALEQLVAWSLPSAAGARRLFDAFVAHERRGEADVIEHAIHSLFAAEVAAARHDGWLAPEVALVASAMIDRDNVMVTLRLREARTSGEPGELRRWAPLPGGTLAAGDLERASARASRGEVATAILAGGKVSWAAAPLSRWAQRGDLAELERGLSAAITRHALRALNRADPLSLAVPVAFVCARENEVRNLRLVAEAAAGRLNPELVRGLWLLTG